MKPSKAFIPKVERADCKHSRKPEIRITSEMPGATPIVFVACKNCSGPYWRKLSAELKAVSVIERVQRNA